jgi:ABC-type multidrug transport system fused ATPase/permease subunit
MKASVAAFSVGQAHVLLLAALLASAVAAAGLQWLRAVAAEDFGMRFGNELRLNLARHAIAIAAAGRKRRLGGLSARMAGDVAALKEWAADGVSACGAAFATAFAGILAMALALGFSGAAIGALILALQLCVIACVWPWLKGAWSDLRRERGRVAALTGDMALSGAAIAKFDATEREARRLTKRNEALRRASVIHRSRAGLLEAFAALTGALALLAAVCLPAIGQAAPVNLSEWATFLFGAGLLSAACAGFARACDMLLGFQVADRRMRELRAQMSPNAAAQAVPRAQDSKPAYALIDLGEAQPRRLGRAAIVYVKGATVEAAALRVRQAAQRDTRTQIRGVAIADMSSREAARWCGLVAPEIGLLRSSVGRNLSLRRRSVTPRELEAALQVVGLEHSLWPLSRQVDPEIGEPDAWSQARLRLARAIVHKPRIVLIAEPTLAHDPATPTLLVAVRDFTNAAIVCVFDGAAESGDSVWLLNSP